jgi:hypothetical protein
MSLTPHRRVARHDVTQLNYASDCRVRICRGLYATGKSQLRRNVLREHIAHIDSGSAGVPHPGFTVKGLRSCHTDSPMAVDCLAKKREWWQLWWRCDLLSGKRGNGCKAGRRSGFRNTSVQVNVVAHDRSILDRHAQFAGTAARTPTG